MHTAASNNNSNNNTIQTELLQFIKHHNVDNEMDNCNPWQKDGVKVNDWDQITLSPLPPVSVLNSQMFVMLFVF